VPRRLMPSGFSRGVHSSTDLILSPMESRSVAQAWAESTSSSHLIGNNDNGIATLEIHELYLQHQEVFNLNPA
jgi:hypothetical protein